MRYSRLIGSALCCLALIPPACAQQATTLLTAPLPDIHKLMAEVEEHQKQLDKVRENYTFSSFQTTEDVDSKGRVTKTETEKLEEFFVNGHPIARLAEKNGKPLEGRELEKETERVTQQVDKAARTPSGQVLDPHMVSVRKLLEMMEVHNPRRIQLRGRATIVFDFDGRREAKTHGIEEDLSKKLEGTIWVDEADQQVAHLDVRFNDTFRVGGGLVASIDRGSNFSLDQALVGEGLWLPTGGEGFFQARLLLVKGIRQRFHEKDWDYKRFHAEAEQGKDAHVVGGK